jgi:hypothetical protein
MYCNLVRVPIFQFFKSDPVRVSVMSVNIIRDFNEMGASELISQLAQSSHVNISLSNIISKFLVDGEESFESNVSNLISEKEHEILKAIRHNFHELKVYYCSL